MVTEGNIRRKQNTAWWWASVFAFFITCYESYQMENDTHPRVS